MSDSLDLVYDLDDEPKSLKDTIVYALQWVVTMFYAVVWGYSIVGVGLELEGVMLARYMATVVLMIGISTLTQVYLGHKYAMLSGPNDIPSLAILYAFTVAGKEYAFQAFTAQAIAGVLITGLIFTGLIDKLSLIWSDLVSGSMIMIIGLAVAKQGVELIASHGPGWPLLVGVGLALLAGLISIKGSGMLSTLPSLITISLGYVIFIVMGEFDWGLIDELPLLTLPNILPYGINMPSYGLIVTMIIVNLMSVLNLYGNLKGYSKAILNKEMEKETGKRSMYILSLVETGLSGLLGVPGLVPYSESIGVITMTRVASRIFLLIGSVVFMVLSFIGPVGGFMAAMPKPVAGAILLGIASTVIGSGAQVWAKSEFGRREILITGFSIFLALGLGSLSNQFWDQLPRMVATIFNNPSITVTMSVIILEQVFFRKNKDQ
jgi:xanthine/uracil permease